MPALKIAIIGAGPAGLALARLLHMHDISSTIFELDANAAARDQGGTVDLHAEGEAGLSSEFQKISRPEGEAMKLIKYDGTILFDENEAGTTRPDEFSDRPEVDRIKLRQMLLDSVAPETVIWNRKLLSVETAAEGDTYDLHFTNGIEKGYDVVVGADGAWSKVRDSLTQVKPFYSGISAIELWALDVDTRKTWLSKFNGVGTCFMFDEGRAIISQKNGGGGIRTYAAVRQPETWVKDCGIDWTEPNSAKKKLIEQYFGNCGDDLKRAILESDDALIPRTLYMLPVGVTWDPVPGLTVIGDAAHLMTPFAGVGVNLALMDSLSLSRALVASAGDKGKLAGKLMAFEAEMHQRAERYAKKTWNNMQGLFSAAGTEERANLMKGRGGH